jgi:hypothetical protein
MFTVLIRLRPLTAKDIGDCWKVISGPETFTGLPPGAIEAACGALISERRMQGAVLEDLASGHIVGFGATAFVERSFAEALRAAPFPGWPAWLLSGYSRRDSPVLRIDGIRRDNSGPGLCLAVLAFGWSVTTGTAEEMFAMGDWMTRAFIEVHRGYHLREIIQETHCVEEREFTLSNGGYQMISDYDVYYQRNSLAPPPAERRPMLLGANREHVTAALSTAISTMFVYHPPLLHLTSRQQEVLLLAVGGKPDRSIAAMLDISTEALKKRWRTIFDAVADHPQLRFLIYNPPSPGLSRRQTVVDYFKLHFEELRPHLGRSRVQLA